MSNPQPPAQPQPQEYIIDADYIKKLDEWLSEHGIGDLQRMQIRVRLKLTPHSSASNQRIEQVIIKEFIPWLQEKRKYYGCCSGVDANDDPEDCDPYDTVLRKLKALLKAGEEREQG